MAHALSIYLRRRVVAAVAAGASRRQAAARFGGGVSSAIRWAAQARATGDIRPKPQGGARRPSRIDAHASLILDWIDAEADLTLSEIAARLEEAVGYRPPTSVVHGFFRRHGFTRKKDGTRRRAGSAGRSRPARNLVRRPARPRSRAPGLHR